jgi:hypothetical protein
MITEPPRKSPGARENAATTPPIPTVPSSYSNDEEYGRTPLTFGGIGGGGGLLAGLSLHDTLRGSGNKNESPDRILQYPSAAHRLLIDDDVADDNSPILSSSSSSRFAHRTQQYAHGVGNSQHILQSSLSSLSIHDDRLHDHHPHPHPHPHHHHHSLQQQQQQQQREQQAARMAADQRRLREQHRQQAEEQRRAAELEELRRANDEQYIHAHDAQFYVPTDDEPEVIIMNIPLFH